MGKSVKITCDGCGHDLTTTSNSIDYRLVLEFERKPGYGAGAYTDMNIESPIDRAYYFCGLECLDHWRAREHHRDSAWQAVHEKWVSEHGRLEKVIGGTVCTSYPSMPETTREIYAAECKAAALAAFPMERPKRK